MKTNETFLDVLSLYCAQYFLINECAPQTRLNYTSMCKSIKDFLVKENKVEIEMKDVDKPLMLRLNLYLLERGDLTNASRVIGICKRASAWAEDQNIIDHDKIYSVKTKRAKQKEKIYLDKNELQRFIDAETHDKQLDIVKDLYIFQAITGISHGDLQTFKYIKDEKGEWLYNRRKKNRNEYWIPLVKELKGVDMVYGILEKYNYKLPKIKNGEYNALIREVAKKVDIKKHLTSHTARKTYANEARKNGWSDNFIAFTMGHDTTSTTIKYYFDKSRELIEMEVKQRQIA